MPDGRDSCPEHPEQWNDYQDEDGCPDRSHDVVCTVVPPPLESELAFARGTTEPVGENDAVLEALALAFEEGGFDLVEVRGHVRGSAGPGGLALARARSVVQELVSRGVPPPKLRVVELEDRCRAHDVVDFRPLRYAGQDVAPEDECDRWPGETEGRPAPCLEPWLE